MIVYYFLVLHRCIKVKSGKIVVLLKIFLNKATFACFVNLSPIFLIFSNNDIVHMSHQFGCHRHYFGVLPQLPSYCIIKYAGAVLIQGIHHCVIHHWEGEVFSMLMGCGMVICYTSLCDTSLCGMVICYTSLCDTWGVEW